MIGESIKDFRVLSPLGRGGMGEVWLAEQPIVKTKVAIKLLAAGVSADAQQVERFFREAVAVDRIKHAGIARIHDVGFHDGRAFLIMELLEGDTLAARLRRGPLPLAAVLDVARQLSSVLAATHAAGITHRDLKPDNIFLVPDSEMPRGERVKVLDFGIAKLATTGPSLTVESSSMGTPAYMAPEQWVDAAKADARADVYSLGCIVHEMVTGQPAFAAGSLPEACTKHLTVVPARLATVATGVPPELDELVAVMLAKAPEERPTMVAVNRVVSRLLDVPASASGAMVAARTGPDLGTAATTASSSGARQPDTTLGAAATALPAIAAPPARPSRTLAIAVGAVAAAGAATLAIIVLAGGGASGGRPAIADAGAAPPPVDAAPAPALRSPALGLATLDKLRDPTPRVLDDLKSETVWTNARDDLADAATQPGAPARWRAARELAAGEIAVIRRDSATALAAFERAVQLDATWALPDMALAAARSEHHDLDGALAAARTAQRLDPAWWQGVAAGARALAAANKLDDAIGEYRRAIALAPDNAVLLAEVALAYHGANMDHEADVYAGKALALDNDLVEIHVLRAERALERGDGAAAQTEAEAALAVSPKNVSALLARGDARALHGDRAAATADYQRALDLIGDRVTGAPAARVAQVKAALAAHALPPPRNADAASQGRSVPTAAAPTRTLPTTQPTDILDSHF
nr:protein kinase [Kofleriaceae bacterium]